MLCKQNPTLRKELQKLKEETKRLNVMLESSKEIMVGKDDALEKLGTLCGALKDECYVKSKGITNLEEKMSMIKNLKLKEANDNVRKFVVQLTENIEDASVISQKKKSRCRIK